ncbi:hypothetical protein B0T22DRAFT_532246 [Podospora appendiculata]|uniref:NADH dehydrogenase [ubiquinone] 1 alpha subcomplex subunit n=1 Tax=Podospora appendiculata TaxID=314037 RepID=A0AAE1CFU6_9PEZI|nr:hypothetical protein B0T22DRAFT_532246 [Podospora appendiculata]
MPPNSISPILQAWHKWKGLRLPWRKQFLVGSDLKGNTFWEFRDVRGSDTSRWRRIVRSPPKIHYGEVTVTPAWHQWLRHTRHDPPSIEEQRADVLRQERIKILAAQADARWAAKPGLMDKPKKADQKADQSAAPSADKTSQAAQDQEQGQKQQQKHRQQQPPPAPAPDPWKQAQSGSSGGDWQPKAWTPTPAATKKP